MEDQKSRWNMNRHDDDSDKWSEDGTRGDQTWEA